MRLPMRLRTDTIGALNLFSSQGVTLAADDLEVGQALADVTTIAIMQRHTIRAGVQLAEQLQTALNSRIAIEQAKGVVAEYAHLEMDAAFELLRTHARRTQTRLSDLAAAIASGRLAARTVTGSAGSEPETQQ